MCPWLIRLKNGPTGRTAEAAARHPGEAAGLRLRTGLRAREAAAHDAAEVFPQGWKNAFFKQKNSSNFVKILEFWKNAAEVFPQGRALKLARSPALALCSKVRSREECGIV